MRKMWVWIRALLAVVLLAGLAVGIGFLVFVKTVQDDAAASLRMTPQALPDADGIVVWTGPGGGRLGAAADALKAGKGERLLVSGVNGANKREDMANLLELPPELADCCLDLDYSAVDTVGNARETWAWVEALGYEHIILITSAYHMPRARVALGAKAGRIRVTSYAAAGSTYEGWWKDAELRERLGREYGKLLVSWFREPVASREPPIVEIEVEEE